MANATIRMIPLDKLTLSARNVRVTPASEADDAELYASIRHSGVKQNLVVHEGEGGLFHVHAGGRRLKALQKLVADGHLKGDFKVPCRIEDEDLAEDTSTAENVIRCAMSPYDEFMAYASLIEKGRLIDEVALKFGVPVSRIQKRLKLARVAPAILDRFRAGTISLECVMAFTLSDDHTRQLEVMEAVEGLYSRPSEHSIRRLLTETAASANSKFARFVGLDAYKADGGAIVEDLFADSDSIYLEDVTLLERLVMEKLEAVADELRQSWKWAEVRLDVDYGDFRKFGRVYPAKAELDPAIEAEWDVLTERLRQLEQDYDEESWTDELQEDEDRANARVAEIEDLREQAVHYSDGEKAIAGCVVTLDHGGDLKVEAGLVRPDDLPARAEDGEGEESTLEIDMPAVSATSRVALNPVEAKRKEEGLSTSLVEDLRASRHQILKAHLAADPATAFDLLIYSMCKRVFGLGYEIAPVRVSLTHAEVHRSREAIRETVAARMLGASENGLDLAWMQLKAPDDFEALSSLSQASKNVLVAWCTAHALEQQLGNDAGANPVVETAARRMRVDMAACWRPTAANYWNRVRKGHALDKARELIDDRWADDKSGDKKLQIAASMEAAFAENAAERAGLTPEVAARTSTWLPDGMDIADPVSVKATEAGEDEGEGAADVEAADDPAADEGPEGLPTFLAQAAE